MELHEEIVTWSLRKCHFVHFSEISCPVRTLVSDSGTQAWRKRYFSCPHPSSVGSLALRPLTCYFFLNERMVTTSIVPLVFVDSLGNVLLEYPKWLLGDFFLGEIISDHILNQLMDILVPFPEIFDKFIKNHLPKLLPLLNGLSLLNGWVQLTTLAWPLGFCVLLNFTHKLYYCNITHTHYPFLSI